MYRNALVGREGLGPGPTPLTRFREGTVNHLGGGLENNINILLQYVCKYIVIGERASGIRIPVRELYSVYGAC